MKMIKEYYPEYMNHQIAVVSPCLAKKREFQELGLGDFNIAFKSLADHITSNEIDLSQYPEEQYTNPAAERAVLFSSPGGLAKTVERWVPGISNKTRKIEGVDTVYEYLSKLPESISQGNAPLLIDCLNCEQGCNDGPLTVQSDEPLDTLEILVEERKLKNQEVYGDKSDAEIQEEFDQLLSKYWNKDLYRRSYRNLTMNNAIHIPSDQQMRDVYEAMHKYNSEDIYDCNACGYETCENMAIAVYHGLNRPANCHFFMAEEARRAHEEISENEKRLRTILYTVNQGFCLVDTEFNMLIVNPSLVGMLSSSKEKLIGKKVFEQQFKACLSGGKPSLEVRIQSKEGVAKICLFTPTPYYDNDELQGYFAFLTDVTPYKRIVGDTSTTRG